MTVPPVSLFSQPRFTAQAFASSPRWLHIPSPNRESGPVFAPPTFKNHEVWPEPRHYTSPPSFRASFHSQPRGPQPSQGALGQAKRDPTDSCPTSGRPASPNAPSHFTYQEQDLSDTNPLPTPVRARRRVCLSLSHPELAPANQKADLFGGWAPTCTWWVELSGAGRGLDGATRQDSEFRTLAWG